MKNRKWHGYALLVVGVASAWGCSSSDAGTGGGVAGHGLGGNAGAAQAGSDAVAGEGGSAAGAAHAGAGHAGDPGMVGGAGQGHAGGAAAGGGAGTSMGEAGSSEAGTSGTPEHGGSAGSGGNGAACGPCDAGKICVRHIARIDVRLVECVADPCAPAALTCGCAVTACDSTRKELCQSVVDGHVDCKEPIRSAR